MVKLQPQTFMGRSRRSWRSTGLCIDLSEYRAGCFLEKHLHTNPFFCFTVSGAYDERSNGFDQQLRRNSLVYHPSGCNHSNNWQTDGRCLHVDVAPSFLDGVNRSSLSDTTSVVGGGQARDLARHIYEELMHADRGSALAFEGLTLALVAMTIRERSRESTIPRWLDRVRDQLREEQRNCPPIKQMAAESGVHPTYLATSFQRHFGVSIGEFIRSQRIEQAKAVLAQSDEPLGSVAIQLGFSDQSHFCRAFKGQTGQTPREYRRLFGISSKISKNLGSVL
jgi:AraC family transcriptional regulator